MFTSVIVGVDGRDAGRDAIALARLLVSPPARLMLANVYHGKLDAGDGESDSSHHDAHADKARALLEKERAGSDIEADLTVIGAPSVAEGLHALAQREDADLIVVGSAHRGSAGRVFVGDDTRDTMNGAPCAVAVAPKGYSRDAKRLTTIGVGYDASRESEAALELARGLAREHGAQVRALQVIQLPGAAYGGIPGIAEGDTINLMMSDAQQALEAMEGVQPEVVVGFPGEELTAFAERVDLLVVGSRGQGPVRRLVVGSTAQHLAAHAHSPLLVLERTAVEGEDQGSEPATAAADEAPQPAAAAADEAPQPAAAEGDQG